jgi:hypothetical protein
MNGSVEVPTVAARNPLVRRIALRFVAGEELQDGIQAARELARLDRDASWQPFAFDRGQRVRVGVRGGTGRGQVAESVGPEGRYLHFGLTSSDVVDTALALQLKAAGELLVRDADRLLEVIVHRARAEAGTGWRNSTTTGIATPYSSPSSR